MAKSNIMKQTWVHVGKNARIFMNQKDWIRFILSAVGILWLVCWIVGKDMFTTYESTKSGFFTILSAAIWIGVFNSIQGICKEHATIRNEYRSGLHMTSYILAHVIFDSLVCLIQTFVLMAFCYIYIDFPEEGIVFSNSFFEYFITFFLVILGSDIMGIMISALASKPNAAMTIMPFILIIQLVMSGVLFELKGAVKVIAKATVSKWGMSALGSIGDLNSEKLPLSISLAFPQVTRLTVNPEYDFVASNLFTAWGNILLISFICFFISIVTLKIKNRGA